MQGLDLADSQVFGAVGVRLLRARPVHTAATALSVSSRTTSDFATVICTNDLYIQPRAL